MILTLIGIALLVILAEPIVYLCAGILTIALYLGIGAIFLSIPIGAVILITKLF